MSVIKPAWIDVELPPPEIGSDGFTGCLPLDEAQLMGDVPLFESSVPKLIPRNEWQEIAAERGRRFKTLIPYRNNQGREGSCVGNGATRCFDYAQAIAFGPDRVVPTSAMSVYRRIGRSASSGAVIGDALTVMQQDGCLPLGSDLARERFRLEFGFAPKHTHPATGFSNRLPSGWEETGHLLLIDEFWRIESMEGFVTALFSDFAVVYGRSRHCICGTDYVPDGSKEYIEYDNSWGEQWGDNGFGYDSLSFLERQGKYGWFAIRTSTARLTNRG